MPRKAQGNGKMVIISTHVTPQQLQMLDKLVELGLYPNRSEAIRMAISKLIEHHCKVLGLCKPEEPEPGSAQSGEAEAEPDIEVQFLDAR